MIFRKFLPLTLVIAVGTFCLYNSAVWVTVRSSTETKWFGVNYYPQGKLWRDFWQDFDKVEVNKDFSDLSRLGFNTVRIFIHHEYFTTNSQTALRDLRALFDIADTHKLKIILTLFDWAKPYHFDLNSGDFVGGAVMLVEAVAAHPALLMIDLKNEADHDFVSDDRTRVNQWLFNAFNTLKSKWPNVLFTVGWLWIFEDIPVNGVLDVLSFHHFPEQGALADRIKRFRSSFSNQPLLLEEVGKSTSSDSSVRDIQEQEQARFLEDAIFQTLKEDLKGALIWTMHDHPNGKGQQRPISENGFGIFALDGRAKPAATMLKSGIYKHPSENQYCLATGQGKVRVQSPLFHHVLAEIPPSSRLSLP